MAGEDRVSQRKVSGIIAVELRKANVAKKCEKI